MIELRQIGKSYGVAEARTEVLRGIDLKIEAGEFVAIMGPSGSGKSTLLNILGALDVPSNGHYMYEGVDLGTFNSDQRALFRRHMLGFVFQGFHLAKKASAIENVEMPLIYLGIVASERHERARAMLQELGLGERLGYEPSQLSGGQQQRVAIARAMVTRPRVLIADEPTGNLDSRRSHEIMELIAAFNAQGITVIMVTHEEDIAAYASRVIMLRDGVIESEKRHVH